MTDHQQPSGYRHSKGNSGPANNQYAKIESLVEAMKRDGVEPVSDADVGLVLRGENKEQWEKIVGDDSDLVERFVNGAPFEDPPTDTMSVGQASEKMQKYGVEPSWTSRQLDKAKINTHYLVDDCLVEGQHCVIAGPSKAMKTSLAIDLALSLATSTKFIGRFQVKTPQRVLFLSAESGMATLRETARRVAKSKGMKLADVDVAWNDWVPRAKTPEHHEILAELLEASSANVLIADPLYLMLDGESQANLSANGEQIQAIVNCCRRRNVTAILIDHVKRGSENAKTRKALQLDDVSGAGKAENFRQWMLVGRRKEFDPNCAIHDLWLTIGGSAGHSGLFEVTIDERRDDAGRRTWSVEVERHTGKRAGSQRKKPKVGDLSDNRGPVGSKEDNPFQ
jgi:hypothetical protein